jgi:hypothetical protein
MLYVRTIAAGVLAVALIPAGLDGQTFARYRDFELKTDLASVSALTGVAASAARLIHQRPALLQELGWRPSQWSNGSTQMSTDPVEHILFAFYGDQLFRIVVDYGYRRTEGMTDADMIAAITEVYGVPRSNTPDATRAVSRLETESGSRIATWGDAEHALVLYRRSSYLETFRLIVTERAIEEFAATAAIEAARIDEQEAPAREVARQQKAVDDSRAAADRARTVNKETFRP